MQHSERVREEFKARKLTEADIQRENMKQNILTAARELQIENALHSVHKRSGPGSPALIKGRHKRVSEHEEHHSPLCSPYRHRSRASSFLQIDVISVLN